jgi:hypothetical protein
MINIGFMTGKNRAIDFCFFHKFRSFSDGLSLIEFELGLDWFHGDHNPQYKIFLAICNFAIIDICWYNIHHVEEEPNTLP